MNFIVVDDDPVILQLMKSVLEEVGHKVKCYNSSTQALREIPVERPDCVISDVIMPEMDGFELCREIRNRPDLAAIKIIMCSSKSYEFDQRRAKELGADGYIVKPIQRATLPGLIAEILSEKVTVSYWGVHGTLPVPGPDSLRYGGNTPCVSVEIQGEPLHIFDCGSGIKKLSDHLTALEHHSGKGLIHGVVANNNIASTLPEAWHSAPVPVSKTRMDAFEGVLLVEEDVVAEENRYRHDPVKLAATILRMYDDRDSFTFSVAPAVAEEPVLITR